MKTIYPHYYESFRCIADKCRHNCCIGWEIDIDEESLGFYNSVEGDFGKRLKADVSLEGTPHFILGEGERCPFLNSKNLCDIFTNLGEERLCQICSDHPRFYNYYDGYTEAGLGLCCEEAARLIITDKAPFALSQVPEIGENFILDLRCRIFGILTDRSLTVNERVEIFLELVFESKVFSDINVPVELYEKLERLDADWSRLLELVKRVENADTKEFDLHMKGRETEYEQFLCYLIYRHFIKAEFLADAEIYAMFAAVSYRLIYSMGVAIYAEKGDFTVADQLEIMRLFSSEIEYSDENVEAISDYLDDIIFSRKEAIFS